MNRHGVLMTFKPDVYTGLVYQTAQSRYLLEWSSTPENEEMRRQRRLGKERVEENVGVDDQPHPVTGS